MTNSWLYIMLLMFGTSIIGAWTGSIYIEIFLDLAVLGAAHFLLRKDPMVDYRTGMIFMIGLTIINILVELNLISRTVKWEGLIGLIVWSWFGAKSRILQLFILGSLAVNTASLWQLYKITGYIEPILTFINILALLWIAYINKD